MSIRSERVAGEIQKSLAAIFLRDFSHLYQGLLTVTIVRLSQDLRHCRIYLSIIAQEGSRDQMLESIRRETPHIRAALAHALRLRYVPELEFFLDDTQDEVDRISYLFQEIHRREQDQKPPEWSDDL